MNFAALPPEVNSGLMYAGPGSASMLTAAAAWDGLATELQSAASAYQAVTSSLTKGPWLGPSSGAMAAATSPYIGWLSTTAALAESTATRARAAVAAYETAFTMTVPPPVITANRGQLAALVTTNIFGQNSAAIAATEAHYAEMWAQDAVAMYDYAGTAGAAADLTPFAPPPRTTDPAALSGHTVAIAEAAGNSAGTGMQMALSQLGPATAGAAQGLAAPAQAIDIGSVLSGIVPPLALSVSTVSTSVSPSISGAAWNAAALNSRLLLTNGEAILNNTRGIIATEDELQEVLRELRGAIQAPAASGGFSADRAPAPVSAGMGRTATMGALSVPLAWTAAAPGMHPAAYGLPIADLPGAPAMWSGTPGTAFSEMALAGMGGSALAGTVRGARREHAGATPGRCLRSAPGAHVKEAQALPESPVAEMVAGIRDLSGLRDSGLLTAEEFDEQKQRLLCRPLR